MNQLELFRPPQMLLSELHLSVGRMELETARARLAEYANSWGETGLTWEPHFLDFWKAMAVPSDADDGWLTWRKLRETGFWPEIPLSVRLGFQTHYFELVVGLIKDDAKIRTPCGISKGYLNFLAGRLDTALKLLQLEVGGFSDDPVPQLHLGNTQFLLNDTCAARGSYRDALLKALKPDQYPEILDAELRTFLAEVEASEWAVIEACIRGLLPVRHLRSSDSMTAFLQEHGWLTIPDVSAPPSPIAQFYTCLVISESRGAVEEEVLMRARLQMKLLSGRLHKLHMETLDAKLPAH